MAPSHSLVFVACAFLFTALQLYQAAFFSWDPLVYALEGKWFCASGTYFEFLRPPFPGVMHCVLGNNLEWSPFLATVASCILYAFAVHCLRKKLDGRIDSIVFFAFAFLLPLVLFDANKGSDLWALAFFLLAYSTQNAPAKGALAGLATLSRYNYTLFVPILALESFQWKKTGWMIATFLLVWTPWLAYNFQATGQPFFSVEESFYLNLEQRGILRPFDIDYLIALAAWVIVAWTDRTTQNRDWKILGALQAAYFLLLPWKEWRFLNLLAPAIAVHAASLSAKKPGWKKYLLLCLALSILWIGSAFMEKKSEANARPFERPAVPGIELTGNCRIYSDEWVRFYAHGRIAEPLPSPADYKPFLEQGNTLVFFDKNRIRDWNDPAAQKTETDNAFILKPAGCAKPLSAYSLKVWREKETTRS